MSRLLLASLSRALQRQGASSAAAPVSGTHVTSGATSSSLHSTIRWGLLIPGLAWILGGVGCMSLAEEQAGQPPESAPSNESTAKWRIYTDQAAILSVKGDYKQAERYLQRALAEAQQGFGPADPHVAAAHQNLAELYRLQRKYDQAGPFYEKAIEGLRESYGELDARTAEAMHNTAGFHAESGYLQRAQQCYQRAIDAKRAALGPTHPSVSASLVAMARLVGKQGHPQKAIALLEQQLQYLDGQGQEASRGARMLLQPLADLQRQQGDQEAALQLLRRQYQAERDDDPRSVATAAAITDLANVLQEQGAYDDARALLEEKLSILSLERHTVDVAATLQLVRLELTVGAPDSLLRAHNLAAALCQQVEKIWRRYEEQVRPRQGWFAKSVPADQQQQAQRLTPTTAAALVTIYAHLSEAQQRLGRDEEALASLEAAAEVLGSGLLAAARKDHRSAQDPGFAKTAQSEIWDALQALHDSVLKYAELEQPRPETGSTQAEAAKKKERIGKLKELLIDIV